MSTIRKTPTDRPQRQRMIALITRIARELGVEPAAALAFAEVESNFNPQAAGDLQWAAKKPEKYAQLVRDNARFALNPARNDPSAWHSYGLYQLLAPYHVRETEHPRVLFDPEINARRGIAEIKRLLVRASGDVAEARLRYVGCAPGKCPDETVNATLARFAPIYARWGAENVG